MVERSEIEAMLDQLRFDDAHRVVAESDDPDPELIDLVAQRRAQAEEQAREVAARLIELGEERDIPALVELEHDPEVGPLLALLSESARRRPELFLREASRWEEQRKETNSRRLSEARKALDGLDLELAGGLMNRIDGRFLTEAQLQLRDELLLDLSARRMELEGLDESGDELIQRRGSKRTAEEPWWRRWLG